MKKVPRIGYLATRSAPGAGEKAFLQGLQSLGYIEGQTIVIEWRFAQEKFDRLPELASELVRLKVDVIVTSGGYPTVQAAKNATTTIPIVMVGVSDAVQLGFVASLARPGGNITGISILAPELSGKLLELAKEAIPKASRIAVLAYSSSPNWKMYFKEMDGAARSLGVELLDFQVRALDEIESAFDSRKKQTRRCSRCPVFWVSVPLQRTNLRACCSEAIADDSQSWGVGRAGVPPSLRPRGGRITGALRLMCTRS